MKIPSEDVPQADLLKEVVRAVEAVAAGATTFQDIAAHFGKVERQGRYYRRAAEILGLLASAGTNHSVLNPRGKPSWLRVLRNDASCWRNWWC